VWGLGPGNSEEWLEDREQLPICLRLNRKPQTLNPPSPAAKRCRASPPIAAPPLFGCHDPTRSAPIHGASPERSAAPVAAGPPRRRVCPVSRPLSAIPCGVDIAGRLATHRFAAPPRHVGARWRAAPSPVFPTAGHRATAPTSGPPRRMLSICHPNSLP